MAGVPRCAFVVRHTTGTTHIQIIPMTTQPLPNDWLLENTTEDLNTYSNGNLRVTTIEPYRFDEQGRAIAVMAVSNISSEVLIGADLSTPALGGNFIRYGTIPSILVVGDNGEVIDIDTRYDDSIGSDTQIGNWDDNQNKIYLFPDTISRNGEFEGVALTPNQFFGLGARNTLQPGAGFAFVFAFQNDNFNNGENGNLNIDSSSFDTGLDAIFFAPDGVPLVGEEGYIAQLLSENSTGAEITLLSEEAASIALENVENGFQYSFTSAADVEIDDANPNIEVETVELSDGRKLFTITSVEGAVEVPQEITLESAQRLSEDNLEAFVQDSFEEAIENVEFVEAPADTAGPEAVADFYEVNEGESIEGNLLSNDTDASEFSLTSVNGIDISSEGTEVSYEGGTATFNNDGSFTATSDLIEGGNAIDVMSYETTDALGNSSSSTFQILTTNLSDPEPDKLTGLNVAEGGFIQQEFYRADTKTDKFGFKGLGENGDAIFRIADSNDNLAPDTLTGDNYSVVLVERGTSFEDALESGHYLMSQEFAVEDGMRSFVSIDSGSLNDFMGSTDMNRYTALLVNTDTMETDMQRNVGGLTKETNDRFDARLDRWGSTLSSGGSSSSTEFNVGEEMVIGDPALALILEGAAII